MRLCYHPDGIIYFDKDVLKYAEFIEQNPEFPIQEGVFFDYIDGQLDLMNSEGHHFPQDILEHQDFIQAIEGLNIEEVVVENGVIA